MKHGLRAPCRACGSLQGHIRDQNGQDVVRCECGKYQYCAPRTETGRDVRKLRRSQVRPKQRARIIERANRCCETCGNSDGGYIDIGHVVSVADGKAAGLSDDVLNSDENLIAQCRECNSGWGERTLPLRMFIRILEARSSGKRERKKDTERTET